MIPSIRHNSGKQHCLQTSLAKAFDLSSAKLFAGAWMLLAAAVFAAATSRVAAETNAVGNASGDTNLTAIPLAQVAARAESTRTRLRAIEGAVAEDPISGIVRQSLPILASEIGARLEETSRILAASPSPASLRRLTAEWQGFHDEFSSWGSDLSKRVQVLEDQMGHLSRMQRRWELTRESGQGGKMPPEVLQRIDGVIADVQQVVDKVKGLQSAVLTLQDQVAEEDEQVAQALAGVERARVELLRNLLTRESPAIWNGKMWSQDTRNAVQEGNRSIGRQWQSLCDYAERKRQRFWLHGGIVVALVLMLIWARRSLGRKKGEQAPPEGAALIFDAPIATAIVLSLVVSGWIYPQAPRLLWALCGAVALIPANLVLRRLLDRRLFPVLDALVVCYFVDLLRAVAASQDVVSRLLFFAEMLGAGIFAAMLHARTRGIAGQGEGRNRKGMRIGTRIAMALFLVTVVANVLGYVRLSKFVGHATLSSAYLGLLLYAVLKILEALLLTAMDLPPLSALGMVRHHRGLLHKEIRRWLTVVAVVLWAMFVLDSVSLRGPVFEDLKGVWKSRLSAGAISVRVGDVVLFAATVWAAFAFSRILRFVLSEEVYPRVELAPGLHYSVSTMLHYVVLLAGFLIALGLLGFDLTRLTILAGAFSVGLGFGLQNVVNNFVSGIILLFERPIKVGDIIQLDTTEGVVRRIGIRASLVRTANGSEIIVPNGNLISNAVTNWTLSDRRRLIRIPVSVAAGADPKEVTNLRENAVAADPRVLKTPAPRVLLTHFGGDSLGFELRAWTEMSEEWPEINSDLSLAVRSNLLAHNMTPQ